MAELPGAQDAVALIEFAFAAPLLLLLGLGGMELAHSANTHMRVSQLAMLVADNASRLGDRETLAAQRVFEGDLNDLLEGAEIHAGDLDIYQNGRIIISSLERNADGGQWIHWQRCMGMKQVDSAYGPAGTGETGTGFAGMGIAGEELVAPPNGAVMYVEVILDYQSLTDVPLISDYIMPGVIRSEAAFTVRGSRDLTGIFAQTGVDAANCNVYEAL
ncbi:hypothetical protein AAW01_01560 [Aurantiacibacter gangjinensis]|uniref:TadE-like domain-containing protein n=2 Tax=Aurantiacibacter gangjinensis TaxID=502682 RepID=A0A0G9MWE7_9SPHN|nr:hypothetical protein AAW01_01560 [Aurantiacibacter gangjinensis]